MNDGLTQRIEQLLLRHEESRRTVHILNQQMTDLTLERDAMASRLKLASQRLDSLLLRIPELKVEIA
jgi:methylphosphotriester-DNA--protein-cysteine methyltransferase